MHIDYDVISALPLAFSYYALVGPFTPRQRIFLFLGFFLSGQSSRQIKQWTNTSEFFRKMTRRPGVSKCDLLSQEVCTTKDPGFPSGHMTVTTFFIAAMIRHEMRQKKISFRTYLETHPWQALIHAVVWVAMAMARIQKKAHTEVQVFAGTILGLAVYFVMEKMEDRLFSA